MIKSLLTILKGWMRDQNPKLMDKQDEESLVRSADKSGLSIVLLMFLVLTACVSGSQQLPLGNTYHMSLTHHDFEDWTFVPRTSDEIIITNHSDVSHSIYITHPDGKVENLGVQTPGETVRWLVPDAGEYLLQCWIHPIIRARMKVEEAL